MSRDPEAVLPSVRPLDVVAFRNPNHELFFAMRDLSQISEKPVAISLAGYFVVAHLDGRHTCAAIQSAFEREFRRAVDAAEIERVVDALDEAFLLNTARFEAAHAARRDAYAAADARDNSARWPDAAALRNEIGGMLAAGRPVEAPNLRAIVAPHLDYHRGGPCYADSYATLARNVVRPRRFVILGTNHFGRSASVVATSKDFVTPLGRVATDRAFIDKLESRLGESIRTHEFDHFAEHSVELHVHVLQVSYPTAELTIVPVLCPDPTGPNGTRPADGCGPDLADFADALCELVAAAPEETVVISSTDLSHVGQRFGETEPTTPAFMSAVERSDRELLAVWDRGELGGLLASVRATGNSTRICSIGNMFVTRRCFRQNTTELLRYHQATDFSNETHVTCASAVVIQD